MTETPRKPRLRERRQARVAKSAERQQQHAAQMHEQVQSPLDLLGVAYKLLRGRLVQFERKALAAGERARTREEREAAAARLERTRAEVARICGEASAEMARLTDQIHTERR